MRGWNEGTEEEAELERARQREALPWWGHPAGNTDIVGLVFGQYRVQNNGTAEVWPDASSSLPAAE